MPNSEHQLRDSHDATERDHDGLATVANAADEALTYADTALTEAEHSVVSATSTSAKPDTTNSDHAGSENTVDPELTTLVDPDDTDQSESKFRRWLPLLFLLIGSLLGTSLIAYPYVSDVIHKRAAQEVIVSQNNTIEHTSKQQLDAEMKRAIKYNQTLARGYDPRNYTQLLNLAGDSVMGMIVIPKIGVKLPIYHTADNDVLTKGVGHMKLTSLPVGGPSTHAALVGHNGIPSMKIFDNLDQLRVGDEFGINILGQEHVYRIYSSEVALPNDVSSLAIQPGKDLVTLITCTPYGVNTHRLLLHAQRISGWSNGNGRTAASTSVIPTWADSLITLTLIGLAIGLGIILAFLLALLPHRRRKKEEEEQLEAQAAAERTVRATIGDFDISTDAKSARAVSTSAEPASAVSADAEDTKFAPIDAEPTIDHTAERDKTTDCTKQ